MLLHAKFITLCDFHRKLYVPNCSVIPTIHFRCLYIIFFFFDALLAFSPAPIFSDRMASVSAHSHFEKELSLLRCEKHLSGFSKLILLHFFCLELLILLWMFFFFLFIFFFFFPFHLFFFATNATCWHSFYAIQIRYRGFCHLIDCS